MRMPEEEEEGRGDGDGGSKRAGWVLGDDRSRWRWPRPTTVFAFSFSQECGALMAAEAMSGVRFCQAMRLGAEEGGPTEEEEEREGEGKGEGKESRPGVREVTCAREGRLGVDSSGRTQTERCALWDLVLARPGRAHSGAILLSAGQGRNGAPEQRADGRCGPAAGMVYCTLSTACPASRNLVAPRWSGRCLGNGAEKRNDREGRKENKAL